jgi:glycosyltransferase involved in cell wall biosynthesis
LTINGDENNYSYGIKRKIERNKIGEQFIFKGRISREQVYAEYRKCILVFPSLLESLGLPLIESRVFDSYVIASDLAYAHEFLDGYDKAFFFDPINAYSLAAEMKNVMETVREKRKSTNPVKEKKEKDIDYLIPGKWDLVVNGIIQVTTKVQDNLM